MAFLATIAASLRPMTKAHQVRWRSRGSQLLLHLVLLSGGLFWIYPFLWTLGSSLKSEESFFSSGLNVMPQQFEWLNYVNAWNQAAFGQYLFNTVVTTCLTVVFTLLLTAMAGYVLARYAFPGKKVVVVLIGVSLFLPHGYTIIPVFDIVQRLGLLDTLWSIILVQTAGGMVFNTFLFMGYFATLDRGMEEAARVDGASFHQIFWHIMLPLAGPMLATVALFTFITTWNNFFIPLVFTLGNPDLRTLSVGMYAFIGQNSTHWTCLCAGSVITLAPIILVFVLLQRYFINGVAGAVKA